MKYINGKVYEDNGSEMSVIKLNYIVKESQNFAKKEKEKKDKYVIKDKKKKTSVVKKELSKEDIMSKLLNNSNFKIISK